MKKSKKNYFNLNTQQFKKTQILKINKWNN